MGMPCFQADIPVLIAMSSERPQRPALLNWLFLGMFLWSSWQLAGLWFARLGNG
jgi:hypothetical protein